VPDFVDFQKAVNLSENMSCAVKNKRQQVNVLSNDRKGYAKKVKALATIKSEVSSEFLAQN
jgi:hypothetical protein